LRTELWNNFTEKRNSKTNSKGCMIGGNEKADGSN
jgi:hypothetical protein